MIEVTCFQCRTRVRISPGSYACPQCEQDLRQLLSQEQVSGYFYNRASALAANGEFQAALEEVERGLTFYGSAELHLLAAILAQQLGRYDQMRHHVAAIPLEDSLRAEAEWLLRSHQDRQRTLREGLRVDRNVRRGGIQATHNIMVDELSGRPRGMTPAAVYRTGFLRMFAVGSVVIFSLVILFIAAGELFPAQMAQFWDRVTFSTAPAPDAATGDAAAPGGSGSTVPSDANAPIQGASGVAGAIIVQAQDAPDLARRIKSTFTEAGRADLLTLELAVRVEGGLAALQGTLDSDEQRRALEELLLGLPEIDRVDPGALQIRPQTTYIVQPGDTLWTIVFNRYGNVDRLDEVIEANRDRLPAPDALQPGMELRLPP